MTRNQKNKSMETKEVELRTLRKGALFHFMDETYRKGERTSHGEFVVYGVSPTAWTYGRLGPFEKVEPIKRRERKTKQL